MWQGWVNLGQASYEAGVAPLVESAFLRALGYNPTELASHFNLALGYHLNDKYEPALVEYLKAIQIDPKHPKVWCNLGVLYFQMDKYEPAEKALREAVKFNPEYIRAWDNLAAALGAQDKLDEALDACKRAVELRPDYPEAYFKMGVIYFTRNELEQATTEFQRAALLPALTAYSECFPGDDLRAAWDRQRSQRRLRCIAPVKVNPEVRRHALDGRAERLGLAFFLHGELSGSDYGLWRGDDDQAG